MRLFAVTALCAAPWALAGSLKANVVARGAVGTELNVRMKHDSSKSGESWSNRNDFIHAGSNGNAQIKEVIVIWYNAGNNAENRTVTSTLPVAIAPAAVATHTVIVGGAGGLVYSPDQINAAVGDMVIFEFHSQNHTATQSSFATPCDPLVGGMDTGFMANPNNTVSPAPRVAMQVTVTTPLWFYCRQANHCGKGMTFSINPSVNKTQAMFQQMAVAQKGARATAVIAGGQPAASAPPAPVAVVSPAASAPPAPVAVVLPAASAPPAPLAAVLPAASAPPAPVAVVSPAALAPPAPVAVASPAANNPSMVGGTGQMANGACTCSCLCDAAAFPNAAVQGVGSFGGMSGAMPMSALGA